jgi:hypothetical protein
LWRFLRNSAEKEQLSHSICSAGARFVAYLSIERLEKNRLLVLKLENVVKKEKMGFS